MTQVRFAGLDGHLVDDPTRDAARTGDPVVVLLHGFGAPGDDLVSLGGALAPAVPGARFVFLEAPLELGFQYLGGRAWWHIDLEARMRRQAAGVFDTKEDPEGLASARAHVVASVRAILKELAPTKLVLGGFSQGAMLSLDAALRSDLPLAGLVFLSGTHLAEDAWAPALASRKGLPVFATHGRRDPILPFPVSERLARQLGEAGLDVTFLAFDDGHGIPPQLLPELRRFLARVLA